MISRDSALWWFGIVGAVITAIAVNVDQFTWFSDDAKHWISLGAVVVAAVSGKLATSPLAGDRPTTIGSAVTKIEEAKDQLQDAQKPDA